MDEQKMTGYASIDKPWLKYYTEEAITAPLPECTVYEYLWENNKEHLDDVAIEYFGRKISYRKLFESIDRTAAAFAALGVHKGDIVTVALPNIPENIYCLYAISKLGAIADMIDLRSKGDVLLHYLSESKARLAVVCSIFVDEFTSIVDKTALEKLVVVSPFDSMPTHLRLVLKFKQKRIAHSNNILKWSKFFSLGNAKCETAGKSDDVVCIFHTSGTTGLPKGVMTTNAGFNAMALQIKLSGLKFFAKETMMNQVPPFLAYNALCATHMPLVLHMRMIMLPEYQPDKFCENILKLKPNCAIAGPADWGNFFRSGKLDGNSTNLSFLHSMISGSDALSQKDKDAINKLLCEHNCSDVILEGYGMTEIGSAACTNVPQHNVDNSVGIPLPFNNFCIYDNDNECELKYGEVGEICMASPTVMKGYFNNEIETKGVLKQHADGAVWLHSGDLGYINKDGNVFLEGRLKRVIVKYNGMKVSPFTIERVIMKNDAVTSCCVVGMIDNDNGRGEKPVAFITVKAENKSDIINAVKDLCRSELSENYLPSEVFVIDKLPLTPNGKVDYRRLEEMANK